MRTTKQKIIGLIVFNVLQAALFAWMVYKGEQSKREKRMRDMTDSAAFLFTNTRPLTYNSTWDDKTGVFTPSDGSNPSHLVSTGDWASIYLDGADITPFIGKVIAVDDKSVTVSTTVMTGITPSSSTNGKSILVGTNQPMMLDGNGTMWWGNILLERKVSTVAKLGTAPSFSTNGKTISVVTNYIGSNSPWWPWWGNWPEANEKGVIQWSSLTNTY